MTLLGYSDGHASEKTNSKNGEKPDRKNAFTKIIKHIKTTKIIRRIKTICKMIVCCRCVPDGKSKATTAPITAEKYSRCMMVHGQGYPLYNPEPDPSLSSDNQKTGIRIGDVGLVTPDGSFDFLFNVCGQYRHVNPPQLPDNFKTIDSVDVARVTHSKRGKHFSSGVEQTTGSSSYRCSGQVGAVLELPEGATLFEEQNRNAFRDLVARHAESWYKYTIETRKQSASNGSLYLVTGSVKTDVWGVAVFDRPSNSKDYLRFIVDETPTHNSPHPRYKWEQSGSVVSAVGPRKRSSNKEALDQCVFLRGFKIMLQQDRWDTLIRSPSQSSSSSPAPAAASGSGEGNGQIQTSTIQDQSRLIGTITGGFWYDSTTMGEGWVSRTSQFHPSDVINMVLLQSNPDAKVALCHDTEWCKVLPKESHTIDMEDILYKIGQSYETKIENDCAFLVSPKK